MSSSRSSDTVIQSTLTQLQKVVEDLQARPDYGASQKNAVAELNAYALLLRRFDAESSPTVALSQEIQAESQETVLPLVADLIDSNVQITKMGQLSTKRTITPSMAKEHNKGLESFQSDVLVITAQPTGESGGSSTEEKDIDPDQAADELLIELLNGTVSFDPAVAEQLATSSGDCGPTM